MSDEAPKRPTSRRPAEWVWLITGPLALAVVVFSTAIALVADHPFGKWPAAGLLLVFMVAAEMPVLYVIVRRQAFTLTLTELPLVLALYFLPPMTVVVVATLAALVTQWRRGLLRNPTKLWFNVVKTAAAASLAELFLLALPPIQGVGPATWGSLFAAGVIFMSVTLSSFIAVMVVLQGGHAGRETLQTAAPTLLNNAINVVVGLIILIAIKTTWWSLVLLAALTVALGQAYRSYARFFRQHRTLADMYDLTRAISESGQGSLADALLGRVGALMQAEDATLWLPEQGRHPEVLLTARVDDSGLLDIARTPPQLRQLAVSTRSTVSVGPRFESDQHARALLRDRHLKDVIVTPLRSGQAVIGTLEVVNRVGETSHFTSADIPVFETVAAHTAVALENSRLVDRLRYDAYHDALTKLPNRRRVTDALREAVRVRAPGEVVAVLQFDVNDLRQVNETLGHSAGDKVLAEVASRLAAAAPSSALVGRVGGDEFVMTLRLENADAALELAARLRAQIRDEMVFDALTVDVDTAVGVVVYPDHGSDPAVLLQRVDLAATAAKAAPGNIQLFSPALESRSLRRLSLAGDLRRALEDGGIEVYFQPKVTLSNRRLVGVECLARWEHPVHGSVDPEDFVAVAEHTGMLGRLTEIMLREGLRRSRDWAYADEPLSITVNLAARTLTDESFPTLVQDLLVEYGVPPERVTFEISESGVMDGTDRPLPALRRLREIGVRLSVDDFGTGRSSLAYLRRLPVHEVKVDRTFVQGMATDPGDLAIVNAVVTLSQQFGLTVVAEGVESELTLELLQDIGCEIGQGFLFSRPLPYERLEAWFGAQGESESHLAAEVRRLRAVP